MSTLSAQMMSTLSAQMAALEKKQGAGIKKSQSVPTMFHEPEPSALFVSDTTELTCLRAPPSSLKSDSDLQQYFRANIEACQNQLVLPAAEPIRVHTTTSNNDQSAIQREYDLDTWKMYHRIQSSRANHAYATVEDVSASKSVTSPRVERRLSDVSEVHCGVSFQYCDDDDEGIFELELDS